MIDPPPITLLGAAAVIDRLNVFCLTVSTFVLLSFEVVIILAVVLCYLGLFSIFAKFMTVVPIQRNN